MLNYCIYISNFSLISDQKLLKSVSDLYYLIRYRQQEINWTKSAILGEFFMKEVTLKDIADETGYSISTVSRVLNGSDKISDKTKREVFQSAERLNYPLSISSNGSSISSLNVLLIITGIHIGEFYASFFQGINSAAEKYNVWLSMMSFNRPQKELINIISKLAERKYDSIILFAPEFKRKDYKQLQRKLTPHFPIISNTLIENPVFSTITFDGYSGGYLAAEHFDQKNYKTCGIIRGPLEKAESRYRYNGFKDYIIQSSGMELVWEFDGDFSFKSGIEAFKHFEKLEKKPRSVFASNDSMCHAFIEAAQMKGYAFPEDIAIVGFDDLPICVHHRPTISSISTSYEKLGLATMKVLREIISNPKQQKGMLSFVPVTLSVRDSS